MSLGVYFDVIIYCKLTANCAVNMHDQPELCSPIRLLTSHFDIYVYCLANQQKKSLCAWQTVRTQSSFQGASMPMIWWWCWWWWCHTQLHTLIWTGLHWWRPKLPAIYSERARERQMSLPNGRPFRLRSGHNSQSCKCHKMRQLSQCNNKRQRQRRPLRKKKNNKAKLLSDKATMAPTMWQLLPIFSNKASVRKQPETTRNKNLSQKKDDVLMAKTRTTDSRYASWETWQQFAVPCVCGCVSEVWQQSATPRAACGKAIGKHSTTEIELK